ncbi:MAG: hypothetical protein U0521_22695 [Anaerolineae bacterium]
MFRDAVVFVANIVPQGLVLTAILSLTIGAINISRKQTLVQRVNAVRSLANVTTLCFDKTGTLTRNRLRVTEIMPLAKLSEGEIVRRLKLYTGNLSHLNRTAAAVASYLDGDGDGARSRRWSRRAVPFTSTRKWSAIVLPQETLIMSAPERVLYPKIRRHPAGGRWRRRGCACWRRSHARRRRCRTARSTRTATRWR